MNLGIEKLKKSKAYPYGLTDDKFNTLNEASFDTIGKLADASDEQLKALDGIGSKWIQRLHNVVGQAIWM